MNGDEMSRGMNQQIRRSNPPNKYNDKTSYSPSASFGPKNNSNHNYNSYNNGNSANYNGQQGQNQRRRPPENRFKTGGGNGGGHHSNFNDRIVKQNDIIIRLLKEIRDRLPAPPAGSINTTDSEYLEQDHIASVDTTDQTVDQEISDDGDEGEDSEEMCVVNDNDSSDVQEQEQNAYSDEER
jgi:hypothetical protein